MPPHLNLSEPELASKSPLLGIFIWHQTPGNGGVDYPAPSERTREEVNARPELSNTRGKRQEKQGPPTL